MAAHQWITSHRPDLPQTAQEDLIAMCEHLWRTRAVGQNTSEENWTTLRGPFITAAWINGASWYQLGQLFNIRRETVRQASLRVMANVERAQLRKNNVVSWERVSAMRDAFAKMWEDDSVALKRLTINQIADRIWELSERIGDESEHNAYDQLESTT